MHVPQQRVGIQDSLVGVELLEVGMEPVDLNPDVVPLGQLDHALMVHDCVDELAHLQVIRGLKDQADALAFGIVAHAPQGIDCHGRSLGDRVTGDVLVNGHRHRDRRSA